jgi:hypothetical protein
MEQIRVSTEEAPLIIRDLCDEIKTWAAVVAQYGLVAGSALSKEGQVPKVPIRSGGGAPDEQATKLIVSKSGFSRPKDL